MLVYVPAHLLGMITCPEAFDVTEIFVGVPLKVKYTVKVTEAISPLRVMLPLQPPQVVGFEEAVEDIVRGGAVKVKGPWGVEVQPFRLETTTLL